MNRVEWIDVHDFYELFTYKHLLERDPELAAVSKHFCDIAEMLYKEHDKDMVLLAALDDLMKAKDSAVRLMLVRRNRAKSDDES